MNKRIISTVAAAVLAVTSPAAIAVAQAPAKTPAAERVSAGPTVNASQVGIRRAEVAKSVAPAADPHMGAGKNVALMVVGGAARHEFEFRARRTLAHDLRRLRRELDVVVRVLVAHDPGRAGRFARQPL